MGHMSARIKAKKGRFGVDGLDPSIRIISPANGASFGNVGSPVGSPISADVTFTGTARDDLNGDVSSSIIWTSSLDGALGTGASVVSTLTVGTHVITASITQGSDVVTTQITITVV